MRKRLVKGLALGCILLGTSIISYAAGIELDGNTKISDGSVLIGDGIQGTDDDGHGISFADGTFQNTKASNCWDTDDSEACDGAEDVDGSGTCDALDCKGADGVDGAQGLKGDQGDPGSQGQKGDQGAQGDIGPTGPTGADGADSVVPGPQGDTGPVGPIGQTGATGTDGSNGLNCWDLNSNDLCDTATEDVDISGTCDALDCQGPAGADGVDGVDGVGGTGASFTIFTTTFPTFDIVAQGIVSKTINCGDPALNLKAISGGYKMTPAHALVQVVSSYPEGDGWTVEVKNYAKNMRWSCGKIYPVDMTGYAICVPK